MENIYIKSEKGINELASNRTLSLRQRHILIMTDGKRPTSYFKKMFSSLDVEQEINNLAKLGYIKEKGKLKQKVFTPSSVHASRTSDKEKDIFDDITTEHLSKIKYFLIRHLQQEVGVLGRDLVLKLEQASTQESLKSHLSEWHMEIRNAKNGKKRADTIVGELNHLLANPDAPELSDSQPLGTAH